MHIYDTHTYIIYGIFYINQKQKQNIFWEKNKQTCWIPFGLISSFSKLIVNGTVVIFKINVVAICQSAVKTEMSNIFPGIFVLNFGTLLLHISVPEIVSVRLYLSEKIRRKKIIKHTWHLRRAASCCWPTS